MSEWVPVSIMSMTSSFSCFSHIKSQLGLRWHSRHPLYSPVSLCVLYSGGSSPFFSRSRIAFFMTFMSYPLLAHRSKAFSNLFETLSLYIQAVLFEKVINAFVFSHPSGSHVFKSLIETAFPGSFLCHLLELDFRYVAELHYQLPAGASPFVYSYRIGRHIF